jgi:hypothetical protein
MRFKKSVMSRVQDNHLLFKISSDLCGVKSKRFISLALAGVLHLQIEACLEKNSNPDQSRYIDTNTRNFSNDMLLLLLEHYGQQQR